ncbi:MAG: zf-HC2 domain-containing protein [Chlamydiota bacterium]
MKTCRGARALMVAYGSRELGGRSRRAVERHISACPACRNAFERQIELERLLGTIAPRPGTVAGITLSWQEFRASLLSEAPAGAESRLARVVEGCRIRFTEWLVPKAALHLSEGLYFGARAAVPVLGILIAFLTYHAFVGEGDKGVQDQVIQLAKASPPLVIRVQFQPGEAGGAVSGALAASGGTLRCGWRY